MVASKSSSLFYRESSFSIFQRIFSPVNRKKNLTGKMLALENKYRKKHSRTMASYNEH